MESADPCGTAVSGTYGSGIRVRGRELTEPKLFVEGTHRARSPEATLRAIAPHFPRVGITRLANVTHLDRIGIPVTLSIRPTGLFLGVDSGKGMDLTAAKASAAMEGIERWRGETGGFTSFRCTYDDARRECTVIPLERMQLTRWGVLSTRWAYRWTLGWDLMNHEETAVPTLRVELPSRSRILGDLGSVMWDSSGLASGNTFLEALHSALLELIERDAITCVRLAMQTSNWRPPLLRLSTVNDPGAVSLLERYARARIDVVVADCTVDTRVTTYWAIIRDRAEPGMGVFGGYGTHVDPGVALCRALNEAAQGRLVFISGSRDDIFKRDMAGVRRRDNPWTRHFLESSAKSVNFDSAVRFDSPTFDADINEILRRLRSAGLEQAIVCDLTEPAIPVAIVRAIVPGLEGYMTGLFRPGDRARQFSARCKD